MEVLIWQSGFLIVVWRSTIFYLIRRRFTVSTKENRTFSEVCPTEISLQKDIQLATHVCPDKKKCSKNETGERKI